MNRPLRVAHPGLLQHRGGGVHRDRALGVDTHHLALLPRARRGCRRRRGTDRDRRPVDAPVGAAARADRPGHPADGRDRGQAGAAEGDPAAPYRRPAGAHRLLDLEARGRRGAQTRPPAAR
ncbi:hypothetical protein G5V59_21000 [Nocardioides sp. W3-2-3]|uniref:hypothetical protein n=1 Tax=Nocardioides convexus TaxID=2712224 RepID=UPI0024183006|nr:hypothetical protein [Nocardioides convexus]NHA01455.1 hypothetical protein [Nocardioides convexus]